MRLSELISYHNRLESYIPIETAPLLHDKLAPIVHEVQENVIQFPGLTTQLQDQYCHVQDQLADFESTIDSVKQELTNLIQQYEKSYFESSTTLYMQMMEYDSADHILDRRLNLNNHALQFIKARISAHGDWKHAGMIIRPGREDWISMLVGCDPLYLIDTDQTLLEPAVLRFNDQYQRRLRTYTVQESNNESILKKIPNDQFAFCLIYNFFHYKPIEIIEAYLNEVWNKLKPGGQVAFTFNNCDNAGAVELAERNFMCYTPGKSVMQICNNLGFELRQRYQIDAACTWIELKKPGTLTSLRGGQALAKINPKNH